MTKHILETQERWLVNKYANWHDAGYVEYLKETPNFRARIATELASRFGVVAATPDGEDTSGRAKLALMSPEQVVERAVSTADLLVSQFEERGWMDQMPSMHERYGDAIMESDE